VNLLSLARRVALAALALLLPATLFAQGGGTRLSELAIEIWPEFDRPAALVILRGAIAEGVKLPAPVSLRLPASSEGPAAVAYSSSPDGSLLNLRHDTATVGGVTTVKFEAPERYFHIEFYESMSTSGAARNYTYTWPGDLAVDRASVVVQEPASAQGMTTDPVLGNLSSGTAGLTYRAGDHCHQVQQGRRAPLGGNQGDAHGAGRRARRRAGDCAPCRRIARLGRPHGGAGGARPRRRPRHRVPVAQDGRAVSGRLLLQVRRAASQRRPVLREVWRQGRGLIYRFTRYSISPARGTTRMPSSSRPCQAAMSIEAGSR
jgi:hypothetical protein